MSITQNRSFLPNEFHSLSEENNRLSQNLISITLNHENLIEQNKQLSEDLKKKDYALIESTLRQKNLQHTLDNVKKQYSKLEDEYKQLFDWMNAERKLQMRDLFKKESQLAMDLAFIERESYRESKKTKNQQLSLYQHRIIDLLKQNQTLKGQVLQLTSEYNSQIYKLKVDNLENELKLKNIQAVESKFGQKESNPEKINGTEGLSYLQFEIKLQNMKQKLDFYMQENEQIRARNNELCKQNKKLAQERKINSTHQKQDGQQSELWRILEKENRSMQFITQTFQENTRLRKEIEEITSKYTLLAQTYPRLIDQFDTIVELQQNLQKLSNLKSLEHELSEANIKSSALQQSLTDLESKYLTEVRSRQALQYKSSILTKRFNEAFMKMNPYFDIYKYEALELDQGLWNFFDSNKDYKQLKEYENKIFQHKRELKETEIKFESKERQLNVKLQEKQRQLTLLNQKLQSLESKLTEMTESNVLLKDKMQKYQMIDTDQNNGDLINSRIIDTEVTVPLLESMVQKLHLQRQQLLETIYSKDNKITELTQQLHQATLNHPIQTVYFPQSSLQSQQASTAYVQFSDLIKHNEGLQKKYEQTVQQLTAQIRKMQKELNDQHYLYQLETKKYETQYEKKVSEVKNMLDKSISNCQDMKNRIQLEEARKSYEKQKSQMEIQHNVQPQNAQNQQKQGKQMHNENIMLPEANQPQNIIMGEPSLTNLDKITVLNDQGNNKLIGQSTVQNLTSTLKKYEQEMSEVLTMCAKLSEEYNELKSQLKSQQQLQDINTSLKESCKNLEQELKETKSHLEQKNKALSSIENLYRSKSAYLDEIKSGAQKETELIQVQLSDEKSKNELLSKQLSQIKEKLYQVASKSQQQGEQSVMNKGQFETIVVMHANKNKEISQLAEKNKQFEQKIQSLMQELNLVKLKSFEKSQEISPLERAELRQLSSLLQTTDLIQLVKKANEIIENQANEIIEKQKSKEREEAEARQKMIEGAVETRQKINEEVKQGQKSLEY